MSSLIKFTPLSGSKNEHALAYLLEIDNAKILLDCGWNTSFNVNDIHLKILNKLAKQIDCILISHGDLDHIGAYAYAYSKLGITCPCYTTIPTHNMGSLSLIEALESLLDTREFNIFSVDDVETAFEHVVQLRYSQPVSLTGNASGITITAFAAGHTIGGTIWKITKDTEEIVYAVDYNHKKERHLNGTILHLNNQALSRPSILITDSYNSLVTQPGRKQRDTLLFETLLHTLRTTTSTILLPVECSTRILELAFLLDQYWVHELHTYPLLFLSHTSVKTMNYAKSMLEWMGDVVASMFANRENPFEFKKLKLLQSLADLDKLPTGSRVILCSMSNLECGFSQKLLADLGQTDPNFLVVLTDRGGNKDLSRMLYNEWVGLKERKMKTDDNNQNDDVVQLDFHIPFSIRGKELLEGEELEKYHENKRLELEAQEAESRKRKKISSNLLDGDEDEDEDEEEGESLLRQQEHQQDNSGIFSGHNAYDIYVKQEKDSNANKQGASSRNFFKHDQNFKKMFPIHEPRRRVDDYGEVIDPMIYMHGEYHYALAQQSQEEKEQKEQQEMPQKKPEKEVHPFKYTVEEGTLDLICKLIYIDFEGRVDGKSIRNILTQVSPRKMILVHGNEQSTKSVVDYCLDLEGFTRDIFAPRVGECVNVSTSSHIYQIKMTDSLISSLSLTKVDDYEIGYLSGQVQHNVELSSNETPKIEEITEDGETQKKQEDNDTSSPMILDVDQAEEEEALFQDVAPEVQPTIPILDVIPVNVRQQHHPVTIGEIKLSDFRKILQKEGFDTEFLHGTLVVNESVIVRRIKIEDDGEKNDEGEEGVGKKKKKVKKDLIVEGNIGSCFFKVRELLYECFATL